MDSILLLLAVLEDAHILARIEVYLNSNDVEPIAVLNCELSFRFHDVVHASRGTEADSEMMHVHLEGDRVTAGTLAEVLYHVLMLRPSVAQCEVAVAVSLLNLQMMEEPRRRAQVLLAHDLYTSNSTMGGLVMHYMDTGSDLDEYNNNNNRDVPVLHVRPTAAADSVGSDRGTDIFVFSPGRGTLQSLMAAMRR